MKRIIVLLMLVINTIAFSQIEKTEDPYIEVTGMAEKKFIPNEIFIKITINERHEGKEKITIEKQEADFKNALKSINISLDNLMLSSANAYYTQVKILKKGVIIKTEYVLKVKNADEVGKVFEKLDELKIIGAYILKVSHSEIDKLNKEVKILAIKAAKAKAIYLLEAIGSEIGKPLIVHEEFFANNFSNNNYRQNNHSNYLMNAVGTYSESKELDIQYEKITIKAKVYIKFKIK